MKLDEQGGGEDLKGLGVREKIKMIKMTIWQN